MTFGDFKFPNTISNLPSFYTNQTNPTKIDHQQYRPNLCIIRMTTSSNPLQWQKNLHPKYTTDEASHDYSRIIKATRKDLLTRRRVSTGIWISSKYLDMSIASSIKKKEGCRLERRRKREWVWRTVSSRLVNRDNRVSPGFHCAGLLQFINRTVVWKRRILLRSTFSQPAWKNERRRGASSRYCMSAMKKQRCVVGSRDFSIQWRHGPEVLARSILSRD